MPEFILDTSGQVRENLPGNGCLEWSNLDAFTQGYIEALFFTESEPGTTHETWDPETQSSLPGDVGFADLAPEALARIVADCTEWQANNADLLTLAYEHDYNTEQGGCDYWFTRNGHGTGFWDREPLEHGSLGDQLSDRCRGRSVDAYLGDDGKVHVS